MRYHALACDYDGTLASHGSVCPETFEALERLRRSGRMLILVTGRELPDLEQVFPGVVAFDRVVAENGALLYNPETHEETLLAEPAPESLVAALRKKGAKPLSVGRSIIATWEPYQTVALDAIRALGLEHHVVFNKGAVMILPSGVNKATGLVAALAELKLSPHNVVGVGDAENDHALLSLCECAVSVANAVPLLKQHSDLVTSGKSSAGVVELIDRMLASDLKEVEPRLGRHEILLGKNKDGQDVRFEPYGGNIMVAGTSGGGKTKLASGILERLVRGGYQFCVIDPEADFSEFDHSLVIGEAKRPPIADEVMSLLEDPRSNVIVNLLGVRIEDRPSYFESLLPRLHQLRMRTGRPHWIVVDESHHLLPARWEKAASMTPADLSGMLLITVHPGHVSHAVLSAIDTFVVIGESPGETVGAIREILGGAMPGSVPAKLGPGEALLCRRSQEPTVFRSIPASKDWHRHQRKYAVGELGADRSFYFRGPEGKLNLRAQNLALFLQIGRGVDDETWMYHLCNGDYSNWFREKIKDEELYRETVGIERQRGIPVAKARSLLEAAIGKRYTAPE